jgi:hypothetical protein
VTSRFWLACAVMMFLGNFSVAQSPKQRFDARIDSMFLQKTLLGKTYQFDVLQEVFEYEGEKPWVGEWCGSVVICENPAAYRVDCTSVGSGGSLSEQGRQHQLLLLDGSITCSSIDDERYRRNVKAPEKVSLYRQSPFSLPRSGSLWVMQEVVEKKTSEVLDWEVVGVEDNNVGMERYFLLSPYRFSGAIMTFEEKAGWMPTEFQGVFSPGKKLISDVEGFKKCEVIEKTSTTWQENDGEYFPLFISMQMISVALGQSSELNFFYSKVTSGERVDKALLTRASMSDENLRKVDFERVWNSLDEQRNRLKEAAARK